MDIAWFRDLIIVIFGICAILAVIILTVLALVLYFRIRPVIDSVKKVTKTVERVTASIEEGVAGPVARIIAFIQGIRSAMGLVKKFTGKEED